MSAIGIDCGTTNCVMAITRKKGIDIITNESSNRQTPNMVSFGDKERLIGEAAATARLRNLRNTVVNVKRFIGRRFADHLVQGEIPKAGCSVCEAADHGVGFAVNYLGESKVFTPVQITAMVLGKLKATVEANQTACRDVVMSVPGFWSERERRAFIAAARIAGLNVVRLLSEHAATALHYGFYKTDLDEKKPRKVMFVDMGYAGTTVSVAELFPSKTVIKGAAYDPCLGGRDFDAAIAEHFAPAVQKKCGDDVKCNKRAWNRLLGAVEKQVKRVISSGNSKAQLTVECLMNDCDFSAWITREEVAAIVEPLLAKVDAVVAQGLKSAGLTPEGVDVIEITGGASRFNFVIDRLRAVMHKEVSRSINCEESVARGCALMAAIISPSFKVRDYALEDVTPYAIRLTWRTYSKDPSTAIDDANSGVLINANAALPANKVLKLNRSLGVHISVSYEPHPLLEYSELSTCDIPEIPPCKKEGETPAVRVHFSLTADGLFEYKDAETVETLEKQVVVEDKEEKKDAKAPESKPVAAPAAAPAATASKPEEAKSESKPAEKQDASAAATAPKETPQEEQTKDKDTKMDVEKPVAPPPSKKTHIEIRKYEEKTACKVLPCTMEMPQKLFQSYYEEECKMAASDKLAVETSEAKNRLESYCYRMQSKVPGELAPFIDPEKKDEFLATVEKVLDWVYDEGECATKGVILKRLDELAAVGDPAEKLLHEKTYRPEKIAEVQKAIVFCQNFVASEEEKYNHISAEDRAPVTAKCNEVERWLSEVLGKQEKLKEFHAPAVTCADLQAKADSLMSFVTPIMNKPKPAPKKEEPKEPKKGDEKEPQKGAAQEPKKDAQADAKTEEQPKPDAAKGKKEEKPSTDMELD